MLLTRSWPTTFPKNIFIRSATTISVRFLPWTAGSAIPCFLKSIPIMHRWQPERTFFSGEPYCFLSLDTSNAGKKSYAADMFPEVHYVNSPSELAPFSGRNLLVTDHTLYELLASTANVCYLPSFSARKFQVLFDCMNSALRREPLQQHAIAVS